jgi:hypothetical protein
MRCDDAVALKSLVMAGLVPAIHAFLHLLGEQDVDARAGKLAQPAQT